MQSITPFRSSEISRIQVGHLDSKFNRRFTNITSKRVGGGSRSNIRELSRQSRTRLIYKARNISGLMSMVTFTYPGIEWAETATGGDFMNDGKAVKNHLRKIRQLFTYRGIYGFWFLEFQKRGAPHFHFILSKTLENSDLDKIRKTWYKMVGTACPHHRTKGVDHQILRKPHAAGAYAAKYSSKSDQKTVPDRYTSVGRFWGLFGDLPTGSNEIQLPLKEMHKLVRIARAAQKSHCRARGYKHKFRDSGSGTGGLTLYNTGFALRYYLNQVYPDISQLPDFNITTQHGSYSSFPPSSLLSVAKSSA